MSILKDRRGQKKGFGHLKLSSTKDSEKALNTEHKIFGKMVSMPASTCDSESHVSAFLNL